MTQTATAGETVQLLATFRDGAGALADPDSATLTIEDPTPTAVATVTLPGLTRLSLGRYRYAWAVPTSAVAGVWTATWDPVVVDGNPVAPQVETVAVYGPGTTDVGEPAYCSIADVLSRFESADVASDERLARLTDLIPTVTKQLITEAGGRSYLPGEPGTVWTARGNGSDVLHVHDGVTSLSLLELSFDGGRTYVTVSANDYDLRGDNPRFEGPAPDGEPWFHVVFTGFGSYANFPNLARGVRLTGQPSWPAVPRDLREGAAQRVRQLAFADGDYSGSAAGGPDQFGSPAGTDRFWPQSTYNWLAAQRSRFAACYLGGGSR